MRLHPATTAQRATRNLTQAAGFLFCIGLLLLLLPSSSAQAQRGALTLPRNLGQLADQAAVIIRGHVVSVRVEPHPEFTQLYTVVVSLRLQETLKGEAGPSFTFRQFIWDIRDRSQAAGYRKGQHLLLLMNRPSLYGLSSPVGLSQGRFLIRGDSRGGNLAFNGVGNAGLFRDLLPDLKRRGIALTAEQTSLLQRHRLGPLPLVSLEALIRQIGGTN